MNNITTPKVSVLIPTYNYGHILHETIQSVLAQTFKDFELIIVDNRSTDNTVEVVKPYLNDLRISFYQNATNLGLQGNWNKCLDYAKGEYIKYLCADDKFHPQLLEKYVAVMEAYPNVSLITCHKQEFGLQSRTTTIPVSYLQPGKKIILATIKNYNWMGEPTLVMFRKEHLTVGQFRKFTWIIDWEMWIRLLCVGDCYIIPETLAYIRDHEGQVTKMVYKNAINYFEEYYLFKSIQQGKYAIDFKDSAEEINKAVKLKATDCAKAIPILATQLNSRKNIIAIVKGVRIAVSEKVIFKSAMILKRKITRKLSVV